MSSITLIDTIPEFYAFWSTTRELKRNEQIEQWYSSYMANWPELRQLQLDDYSATDYDWRQIAREKIFPFIDGWLPAMRTAHQNLLQHCAPTFDRVTEWTDLDLEIIAIIYVGIGCGAGWVTRYQGKPAVLFGLENIADCGYEAMPALKGLVTHEFGHVLHFEQRASSDLELGDGPWWQLYSEGYAQRIEHVVLGQDLWHMKVTSTGNGWLKWCQENRSKLAAEFLKTVDNGEPVNNFFGSWFNINGHSQTGYFLGHEVIRELEAEQPLSSLALNTEPDYGMRSVLEKIRDGSS